MAKRRRKPRKKSGGSGGGGGASRGHPPKNPKNNPIKTMLIGGGVIALFWVFFMMNIGGDSPFNHILNAFSGDEAAEQSESKAPTSPDGVPKFKKGAATATPLGRETKKDQTDLDKLIGDRTK